MPNERRPRREQKEFDEQVVSINRIAKTVKGGRRMRFAALVVVGDRKAVSVSEPVRLKKYQKLSVRPVKQLRRTSFMYHWLEQPFLMKSKVFSELVKYS